MAYQSESVNVRISRRTLWVDAQIYPLQNVTRIRPLEEVRDPGRTVWTFVKRLAKTLVIGFLALVAFSCAAPNQDIVINIGLIGILAVCGWVTFQFVRELVRPKFYALQVETAGTAHTAIASTKRADIVDLADAMAQAIDNPEVQYAVTIENIVNGDQFIQEGLFNQISR